MTTRQGDRGRAARRLAGAFAVAAALLVGGAAGAQEQGVSVVEAVDVARGEVVLGGQAFAVTVATRIRDAQGFELALEELPSVAAGASAEEAAAAYEVGEPQASGERPLVSLQLTGGMPR